MDLRRFLQTVRRYKYLVAIAAIVGLAAGYGYMVVRPPLLTARTLIVVQGATKIIQTEVVIATSNPVLTRAEPNIHPQLSLSTLRKRVQVINLTGEILQFSAEAKTAAQAENIANAVAHAYLAYLVSPANANGDVKVTGGIFQPATSATGSVNRERYIAAVIGLLAGLVLGAIIALGISQTDKRLRERDDIADAIGIPVLASVPVQHPSSPASWTKLLDGYQPSVVHAWSLRKAMRHLGLTDFRGASMAGTSLAVISLSSDRGALALGPQVAVFAASLGIPTALIVDPLHDSSATASLCAACGASSINPADRAYNMRVSVGDMDDMGHSPAALTVLVTVVDEKAPQMPDLMPTTATVLAVSAGAATAEQLARVAVTAAKEGREITGILVADPDPTDSTTGRLPQAARPAHRMQPSRMAGPTAERQQ
jgi:capsular polysaccharide biosynthesis protein